ncbi:MAG: hypothetical protein AAF340_15575 [Pseudomonadota bacterium]
MKNLILAAGILVTVSGCGTRVFTERETNPVTEDYIRSSEAGNSQFAVLSTRPDRRSVLINVAEGDINFLDVCAEPPADVAEAFSRSQAAVLQRQRPNGSSDSASVSSSLSTAVGQLTRRSQGLQFMRDQMFYLCIERMNGTITPQQYAQMRHEVVRLSATMVNNEIKNLPSTLTSLSSIAKSEASIAAAEAKSATEEEQ